jgi:hypothetical protein
MLSLMLILSTPTSSKGLCQQLVFSSALVHFGGEAAVQKSFPK